MDAPPVMPSSWPFIVAFTHLGAIAYAIGVAWLNSHPRHGRFWRDHAWVEVIGGDMLIAITLWALIGFWPFIYLMGAYVLWGAPMILAEMIRGMHREEREYEQQQAERTARAPRG